MDILEITDNINEDLIGQTERLFIEVYANEGFTPLELVQSQFTVVKILESKGRILLAIENQQVIGVVVYAGNFSKFKRDASEFEAEFRLLAVHHSFRRRGIAETLIKHCIQLAVADKVKLLVLSTQKVKMTSAQNLYAKLGFSRSPERDRFSNNGIEFLVYQVCFS